jgi:hypothetical protein
MAARRERERRRPPTEQRYRFGSSGAALDPNTSTAPSEIDETSAAETPRAAPRPASRSGAAAPAAALGAHRPFSAYAAEYAYVGRDLRRVAAVIGTLLVILLVLYLVLPH